MLLNCYNIHQEVFKTMKNIAEYNSLLALLRQIEINGILLEDDEVKSSNILALCEQYNGIDPVADLIERALQALFDQDRVRKTSDIIFNKCSVEDIILKCPRRKIPLSKFTVCPASSLYAGCSECGNISLPLTKEEFQSEYSGDGKINKWLIGDYNDYRNQDEERYAGKILDQSTFRRVIWEPFFALASPRELVIYDRNIGRLYNGRIGVNFFYGLKYLLSEMRRCGAHKLPITIKTAPEFHDIRNRSTEEVIKYRKNIGDELRKICSSHSGEIRILLPSSGWTIPEDHPRYLYSSVVTIQSDTGLDLVRGSQYRQLERFPLKKNVLHLRTNIKEYRVVEDSDWEEC